MDVMHVMHSLVAEKTKMTLLTRKASSFTHPLAGKTTLMDVIAGRKTVGRISGDIHVNGHLKEQRAWSRAMGYVEQMDIHTPAATVIEALVFSARLRLPRAVTDAQASGAPILTHTAPGVTALLCVACSDHAKQS